MLENKLSVEATKNIINTPKLAIEKSPIFVKPNVVTPSEIATKPNVVTSKIAIEKNFNYKIKIPAIKVCVSEMQSKNILRGEDSTKNVMIWYNLW